MTTRIELFRATCPCCRARVTAGAPADMPEGTPFGPGIASIVAYLHGCQMIGYKRLTEVCQGLLGLTISQAPSPTCSPASAKLSPRRPSGSRPRCAPAR